MADAYGCMNVDTGIVDARTVSQTKQGAMVNFLGTFTPYQPQNHQPYEELAADFQKFLAFPKFSHVRLVELDFTNVKECST
jgi:hypothetical protein